MPTTIKTIYDEIANEYDSLMEKSLFYKHLQSQEMNLLLNNIEKAFNGECALDVGCGSGKYSILLARMGYRVYGVDVSEKMIERAYANATNNNLSKSKEKRDWINFSIKFLTKDVRDLNFPLKFDVIVAFGSFLNHVNEWERIIKLFNKVLKPNGHLLMSIDNVYGIDNFLPTIHRSTLKDLFVDRILDLLDFLKSAIRIKTIRQEAYWPIYVQNRNFLLRLYYRSIPELENILEVNGFKIIEKRGVNILTCFLPWIMYSSAFIQIKPKSFFEQLLTKTSQFLDRCLSNVPLIRNFGSNMLIVARKIEGNSSNYKNKK